MNTNCQFPYLQYPQNKSHPEWGMLHGEEFKTAISELAQIRKDQMLEKNPALLKRLDELALWQLNVTRSFDLNLALEMEGIARGASLKITDIVILNNYTDFRDINLPEEGCSTVHVQTSSEILAGQTWDMHRSAKNYLCLIHLPKIDQKPAQLVLSLVGCLGLMGVNTHHGFIGVNNINTKNAKIGLIWPALVRKVLLSSSLSNMRKTLTEAPVTSGHNYLISSPEGGEHFEVTPHLFEKVSSLLKDEVGSIIHTNHCLGSKIKEYEDQNSLSSTTFDRFKLLALKKAEVKSIIDLKNLLSDHQEFPKSICSHFESGATDPSFTCGGGVSDLKNGNHIFWRGCPLFDQDYKEYTFKNDGDDFIKTV